MIGLVTRCNLVPKSLMFCRLIAIGEMMPGIMDILVVYRKDDPSFVDYYTVGERDIYWLLDPENGTYLFDNFLLLQFVRDYEFSVVFNKELKENIIKKIREED